jgi:hypothetical protein
VLGKIQFLRKCKLKSKKKLIFPYKNLLNIFYIILLSFKKMFKLSFIYFFVIPFFIIIIKLKVLARIKLFRESIAAILPERDFSKTGWAERKSQNFF